MTDFPKLARIKSDDENMEKIHVAARKGNLEDVQRLIEMGISPSIQNRFGCTALHLACKFGQVETAKYIASICDVQTAWHGQKPLHLAVLSNKLNLVQALIEGARGQDRPIDALLNDCDENVVSQIGEHFKNCRGQTALHWCVGLGDDYLPMLRLLVDLGASPTAKDKDGETPLMRAMEFRNEKALAYMLSGAAKSHLRLEVTDQHGRSHLHWAISTNHHGVALRMIQLGHDMNVEDEEHNVPLYLAIRAAMVDLTSKLVEGGDPFLIQNAPFHNGTTVLPDRIQWFDFVVNPPPTAAAAAEGEGQAAAAGAAGAGNTAAFAEPVDTAENVEERKQAVIRLLQNKLDEIVSSLAAASGATVKKKAGGVKRINLAPSAPIRGSIRSRSTTK